MEAALHAVSSFLRTIRKTAEQLIHQQKWLLILSRIFSQFLNAELIVRMTVLSTDADRFLLVSGAIALAVGVGFLISAATSFALCKSWGLAKSSTVETAIEPPPWLSPRRSCPRKPWPLNPYLAWMRRVSGCSTNGRPARCAPTFARCWGDFRPARRHDDARCL